MDDLHVDPTARVNWYDNQRNDPNKKRPRHPHADPFEEPIDTVVLSSETDSDAPPPEE